MGLGSELTAGHRYQGLRSHGFGRTLEMPWPAVKGLPRHGYVVTRKDLDAHGRRPRGQGRRDLVGTHRGGRACYGRAGPPRRPLAAKGEGGRSGQVTARYVVVADGANSRFGWALGNQRNRAYPQGMALRGYWTLPAPRRALDRLLARPEGRSGPCDARLRLDFPARGRAGQRGRGAPDHVIHMERR